MVVPFLLSVDRPTTLNDEPCFCRWRFDGSLNASLVTASMRLLRIRLREHANVSSSGADRWPQRKTGSSKH